MTSKIGQLREHTTEVYTGMRGTQQLITVNDFTTPPTRLLQTKEIDATLLKKLSREEKVPLLEDSRVKAYFRWVASNDLGIPEELMTFPQKVINKPTPETPSTTHLQEGHGEENQYYRMDYFLHACNLFVHNLSSFGSGLASSILLFGNTLTPVEVENSAVKVYSSGNFKWIRKVPAVKTFFLDCFLFYAFNDLYHDNIVAVGEVRKFLNSFKLKSDSNPSIRYSTVIPKEGTFARSMVGLTLEHGVTDERGQTLSYLKDSPLLCFVLDLFIIGIGGVNRQFYPYEIDKCFIVEFDAFRNMRLGTKLFIVSHMLHVDSSSSMYVPINQKQEVGNYGRRYNNFNPIPRSDRALMDNLYGVDMEQALQRIVWWLLKDEIELPFTEYYLKNKKDFRAKVASDMGISIEEAKREITAIYQGQVYTKAHAPLKALYVEAQAIKEALYKRLDENSEPARYAKYRMKKQKFKILNKKQKSFMFFYWSWYERELQNIICRHFKKPITLHDGVYTQNKDEFDALDIEDLEREMNDAYDMGMKLSRC